MRHDQTRFLRVGWRDELSGCDDGLARIQEHIEGVLLGGLVRAHSVDPDHRGDRR